MSLGDEAFLQRDYIGTQGNQAVREAVREAMREAMRERRIAGIT
jgi:hypothetical protein